MTATAPLYILEHEAAHTPGRVVLRQGPRSTIVTEVDLIDLLKRVKRTGTVRRAGVALDESQLVNLYDTYFVDTEHDTDCDCSDCDDAAHTETMRREAAIVHRLGA